MVPNAVGLSGARVKYLKALLVLLTGLLIACAWLIFPYMVQGDKLLRDAGDSSRILKAGNIAQYFHRRLIHHPKLELSATFATTEFFQYVDKVSHVRNLRPDKNYIFYVNEAIHTGKLPAELPVVELNVGGTVYLPIQATGSKVAEHHRLSVYSFSKRDENGELIGIERAGSVRLRASGNWIPELETLSFVGVWEAPFSLPLELKTSAGMSPVIILALGAGLLSSVLTPCLLQLVVIFGSIISGFSTAPSLDVAEYSVVAPVLRRKIMQVSGFFVLGFTLLYVLAGAVIGAVGLEAQLLLAEHSRTVAFVAGLVVVLMGIWVGLRGARPMVCKIPRKPLTGLNRKDNVGVLVVSMGYALGCTACFGGAIVATLIVYVGSIGSVSVGAGIMLIFSVGVAIPFLLASWYISRMDSLIFFLSQKRRLLSFVSMVIIMLFGLILMTDNFHTVSDFIYPYLGLN